MNAVFFDNCKNMRNVAQAAAAARVRREVIAEGAAYRVEFPTRSGELKYWNGGRYDVLALAKSLFLNKLPVTMFDPCGNEVDIAAARF